MSPTGNHSPPDPAATPDGYVPTATWPFCGTCHEATVDESARPSRQFNGCGPDYYGRAAPCPVCGAVERGRWIDVFGIPLLPTGRYKMIYTSRGFLEETAFSRFVPDRGRDLRPAVVLFWAAVAGFGLVGGIGSLDGGGRDSVWGVVFCLLVLAVGLRRTLREIRDVLRRSALVVAWRSRPSDRPSDTMTDTP